MKKMCEFYPSLQKRRRGKVYLILKLLLVFFTCLPLGLQASTYAQKTRLNLSLRNTAIESILEKIEGQSEFIFIYEANTIDANLRKNVSIREGSIEKVLDQVLSGTGMGYEIDDRQVLIFKKKSLPEPVKSSKEESFQQEKKRKISGVVFDNRQQSIPGVSIVAKGTASGTISDAEGKFTLEVVNEVSVLVFSFVGMETREVKLGERDILKIQMEEEMQGLNEVVVTALGIKKEKKKLSFSVQEVEAKSGSVAPDPTPLSSLTGKVSGLVITNTPDLFQNAGIKLRGVTPLLVVDGVPLTAADGWEINADDVESYTVLKGPTAAALYGSRGRNGAIQITTKSAKEKGVLVSFNSSTILEHTFIALPKVQNEYGTGQNGMYAYKDGRGGGINDGAFYIWGPKLDRPDPTTPSGIWETPQWDSPIDQVTGERIPTPWVSRGEDNLENFLRPGLLTTNSFSVTSKSDKGDIRIGMSHRYQRGSVPGTSVSTATFNLGGNMQFSDKLKFSANVTYSKPHSDNYPNMGYGRHNFIYNLLVWGGPDIDIRDFKNYWEPGKEGVQQMWYEKSYYNNPYFVANEYKRGYYRDNIYGYASMTYDFSPNLKFLLRSHVNSYTVNNTTKSPYSLMPDAKGSYSEAYNTFFENNTDFLLTYDKSIVKGILDFSGTLGGNSRYYIDKKMSGGTGQLNVPEWYNFANSDSEKSPSNSLYEKQVLSLYGSAEFSIKNAIYLTLTGRSDKSSSLPINYNSYFYPSAGLSIYLSELVNLPDFISSMKLRGAYAKVGSDFSLYSYIPNYNVGTNWDGNVSVSYPSTLFNDDLSPSFSTSYEVGSDIRFFRNRLGVDVSLFRTYDGPSAFDLTISSASGYGSRKVNGKTYRREGMEITLNATPYKRNQTSWDMTINVSTLRRYLDKIYGDLEKLGHIDKGDRVDEYWGYQFMRSPEGEIVFGANNGLPVVDPVPRMLGHYDPDFTYGWTNTFRYKNWEFSFSLDGVVGGKIYSSLNSVLWDAGRHINSVNKWRDDYVNQVNSYIGDGVVVTSGELKTDGAGNVIEDTREFAPNAVPANYKEYVSWVYRNAGTDEANMLDKTFAKLRDVRITYNLPNKILNKTFMKRASFSLTAKNVLYIGAYKDVDLDAYIYSSSFNLQTPSFRKFGCNLNIEF